MKRAAEEYAAASNVPTTVIRATAFAELWLGLLEQTARRSGRPLIFGHGNNAINFVSVYDVACLVERAITDPATRGQIFEIGGPGNLSFNGCPSRADRYRTTSPPAMCPISPPLDGHNLGQVSQPGHKAKPRSHGSCRSHLRHNGHPPRLPRPPHHLANRPARHVIAGISLPGAPAGAAEPPLRRTIRSVPGNLQSSNIAGSRPLDERELSRPSRPKTATASRPAGGLSRLPWAESLRAREAVDASRRR